MWNIGIYYIPPQLTVYFPMTRSVRYQPILHTLYYTLHTEHAYCLSYRFLNNVVITTVIEIVEMVEIHRIRAQKQPNLALEVDKSNFLAFTLRNLEFSQPKRRQFMVETL